MIRVLLYEHVGTGLIIPASTGVVYVNQVGGTTCDQRELEGVFVPIGNDVSLEGQLISAENELFDAFRGSGQPFSVADADRFDALVQAYARAHWIPMGLVRGDRERLEQSTEAWVHVIVDDGDPGMPVSGVRWPARAILTWTNSD